MFRIISKRNYQLEFQYTGPKPHWAHKFNHETNRFEVLFETYPDEKSANDAAEYYEEMHTSMGTTLSWYIVPRACYPVLIANRAGHDRLKESKRFVVGNQTARVRPYWRLLFVEFNEQGEFCYTLDKKTAKDQQFIDALCELYTAQDGKFIVPDVQIASASAPATASQSQ